MGGILIRVRHGVLTFLVGLRRHDSKKIESEIPFDFAQGRLFDKLLMTAQVGFKRKVLEGNALSVQGGVGLDSRESHVCTELAEATKRFPPWSNDMML